MILNIIGYAGSTLIVLALYLVTNDKLKPRSLSYLMLNLIGGVFLVVYQLNLKAYAGVLLNTVFALVALFGIFTFYKKTNKK